MCNCGSKCSISDELKNIKQILQEFLKIYKQETAKPKKHRES